MLNALTTITMTMIALGSTADITVTRDQLEQDIDGIPGSMSWEDDIAIHKDVVANGRIEVTSKGNGTLEVFNLSLKVYDGHDDTAVYKDQMLLIEFTDLNEDGYLDLMVTGIHQVTPEKGDGILDESIVVFMCHFDPRTTRFKKAYQQMPRELKDHFKVD